MSKYQCLENIYLNEHEHPSCSINVQLFISNYLFKSYQGTFKLIDEFFFPKAIDMKT